MRSAKQLANLEPYKYKPGDEWKGNASGRPKRRPITDEYFQISDEPLPEALREQINKRFQTKSFKGELLPKGTTWARAAALRRAMDALLEGGFQASKEMREAMEGKAAQRLEITTAPKTEITIRIKNDRKK